jgi:6-phosphogluconolactonase
MLGEVVITEDVPGEFANRVIDAFIERRDDTFAFATSGGNTARRCYERLAVEGAEPIDWWAVDVYWSDERCVPEESPESNQHLVREALLRRLGAANQVYPMRCEEGPDPYQLKIGDLAAIDVVHLGMGPDGHTASLFPDSPALNAPEGRLVVMNEDPLGHNPHRRMTFTFSAIAKARLVLVTVEGEAKRDAFTRLRAGEDLPASRIRPHQGGEVVWIVDPAAAGA